MEEAKLTKVSAETRAIEGQYRRSLAIVELRPKLVSAAYIWWGMLNIFLIAFFFLAVILYVVSGTFVERRLMATLDNNVRAVHATSLAREPSDLVIGNTSLIRYDAEADLLTTISNPNDEWYATFVLRPSTEGGTESALAFLNPGEERTFVLFGVDDVGARDRLIITDVSWTRLDRHLIDSSADWLAARTNIAIDNVAYARDVTVGSESFSRVTFQVTNRTAYSYWQPKFLVRVLRGSTTLAVNEAVLPELVAGESQEVDLRFFGDLPATATVIVEPIIFYFDPESYSGTPQGEESLDILRKL